jgi:hypothetical protein
MPRPLPKLRRAEKASPRVLRLPHLLRHRQPPRGQLLRSLPVPLHQQPNRSRRQFDPQFQAQRQLKRLLPGRKSLRARCRQALLRAQLNQLARPLLQRPQVRPHALPQHQFARQHQQHPQRNPARPQLHARSSRERLHRDLRSLACRQEFVPLQLRRQASRRPVARRAQQERLYRDNRSGNDRPRVPCSRVNDPFSQDKIDRARRKDSVLRLLRATRTRRADSARVDRRWAGHRSVPVDDPVDRAVRDLAR